MTDASKTNASDHPEAETREFVTLWIDNQLFGVEVSEIHDVFPPKGLTSVPLSQAEIAGVLNLRGHIVTAIDARARLGLAPRDPEAQDRSMAVGIENEGESFGLIVDQVGEVLRLPNSDYEANPSNLDPRWREVSRGVYRLDGRLLVVLNLDRTLGFVAPDTSDKDQDFTQAEESERGMKRILIVDDSGVIRRVARQILENLDFECEEAVDGAEALDACRKSLPDAVLLDWNMPVMNGIDFLRQLRKEPGGEDPVVVFCTTENDMAHISEALSAGANEYIMKPFDGDIVEAKLSQVGLI